MSGAPPPILVDKDYDAPSAFSPENLLREARRQRGLAEGSAPALCLLDPDGDIEAHARTHLGATRCQAWACYHTGLWRFRLDGLELGVIGRAVGAPFATLLAEQLFASGCRLLVSVTSAGRLAPVREPPYFVLIERARRDEGVSYHYLPPATYAEADPRLLARLEGAFAHVPEPVLRGAVWTTDAPYRETEAAIGARTEEGLLAVEMEAAALYAFAAARGRPVICFAQVTNSMGVEGDFEKGEAGGAPAALALVLAAGRALLDNPES